MHEYFGWAAYWADWYLPSSLITRQRKYPLDSKEDPHLRSALDVAGYGVWATDGKIGQLKDFIIEKSTWHLNYIVVSTGDWLFEYPVLVSTRWVKSVSWDTHCVNLDHDRKDV